jgi:hypothetical protein
MLEVLPTLSPLLSIQMEMARASIKMPKGRNIPPNPSGLTSVEGQSEAEQKSGNVGKG